MTEEKTTAVSRRQLMARIGGLAAAAYTVPAFTTMSMAHASDGGSAGSGNSGGSGNSSAGSSPSEMSGSSSVSSGASGCADGEKKSYTANGRRECVSDTE